MIRKTEYQLEIILKIKGARGPTMLAKELSDLLKWLPEAIGE